MTQQPDNDQLIDAAEPVLEQIALQVVTLEPDDIPALGKLLNGLSELADKASLLDDARLLQMTQATRGYLEKLILAEQKSLEPVENAVAALQEALRDLRRDGVCSIDITPLLDQLGAAEAAAASSRAGQVQGAEPADARCANPGSISQEDLQVLSDFVVEALENLESIEVKLIDLEQDPGDKDTINAIFRPFHTIKGVSGFLNLDRINQLAHCTENLLDSARQGEFRIDDAIIDVILEAVDTLKQLIGSVQNALGAGHDNLEGDADIRALMHKIEQVLAAAVAQDRQGLGDTPADSGQTDPQDLQQGLARQKMQPDNRLGHIVGEDQLLDSREVMGTLREQRKRVVDLQVKVDTHKLDNLIDLTGELVIAQSILRQNQAVQASGNHELDKTLNQLTQIVSGLQTTAMSMRMVPIKSTFQKMVRLVRDLAKASGKDIGLQMSGEDTEIDRNVVDELYEPMVHMIRNAVDHGLEAPGQRRTTGKNPKGRIELQAYHKGGNIVIEIADDGRGLDAQQILLKARAANLIAPDAKLPPNEIFDLIFHPGFSTAQEVTDVSGRGVGMDVVKRGIEKLRGRLDIRSEPGQGSTFVISLPLTLAIIEGMVVRVGRERYILPTMAIVESFKPRQQDYFTVEGKGEMIMARGNLIPLIRLDQVFGVKGECHNPWDGLVVAVEHKEQRCALLLDELLGKEEIVIKSLGAYLKNVKGLAGGAILGDGRVGLIVDIAGLFELAFSR